MKGKEKDSSIIDSTIIKDAFLKMNEGKNLSVSIQFDDDLPIEVFTSVAEKFELTLSPGGDIEFSDGKGKKFKMFCKEINN